MAKGKRPEPVAGREPSEAEVLLGTGVEWDIGGKLFVQRPLTLRHMSEVLAALSREIEVLSKTPALAMLLSLDSGEMTGQRAAPVLFSVISSLPDALPKLLAAILRTDDWEFLAEYITPACAVEIIETFVDQNETASLVQSFFGLARKVRAMVPKTESEAG